jgi:CRISPR-associated endoribonuclease Cas6
LRIRIIFRLKNRGAVVPFHHQYLLSQLIKGVIVSGGKKQFLNFDYYNFSGLKGQTKVSRKGLHFFSQYVTLVFATPDEDFLNYFLNKLFKLQQVNVGSLLLQADHVEQEELLDFGDHAKFVCISPVVLLKPDFNDDNSKRFIIPSSDGFSDILYECTMERLIKTGYTSSQIERFYRFQVMPDEVYLKRLREQQKKFARIYPVYDHDVKYEVRGYTFPFTIYAEKEVLQFIFQCGMGYFTQKGFGMLDIANADYHHRLNKYEVNLAAH